jgi:hypothetical protein
MTLKSLENGMEQWQNFVASGIPLRGKSRIYCQYYYRHYDGELFSCVKPTLALCRAECDKWLAKKQAS